MKIRLKEVRKSKCLSLRELAEMTEISKSELNDIENGKVLPRIDVYCKIAKALGLKCTSELCDCGKDKDKD